MVIRECIIDVPCRKCVLWCTYRRFWMFSVKDVRRILQLPEAWSASVTGSLGNSVLSGSWYHKGVLCRTMSLKWAYLSSRGETEQRGLYNSGAHLTCSRQFSRLTSLNLANNNHPIIYPILRMRNRDAERSSGMSNVIQWGNGELELKHCFFYFLNCHRNTWYQGYLWMLKSSG